jgi:gamma-glutamylcyclotransferase (GGCT)/AIG2-like uncharacterized protein YtfP
MHIFTYGSLMYAPVWRRVVAGTYEPRAGLIRGYARQRIRGELYPALLAAGPKSTVPGVLYLDVSPQDVGALDQFEGAGTDYRRIELPVELEDGSVLNAATFLYLHPERVEAAPWEAERFEAEGLQRFLDTYCRSRLPG